jgi:hypothetical protein
MTMATAINRRAFLLALGGSAALAACSSQPPRARFPELTYGHLGGFRLDVSRIDIVTEYQPPMIAPNIEHLMPVNPVDALQRWGRDRLQATGTPGRIGRFVITDAKVLDTPLPRSQGMRGAFTTDQTNRYDGTLACAVEVREERANYRAGMATAWATRSRTVPEGITLNDRERVYFELVESLMNDINAELDRQIKANLGQFIR